MTTHSTLPYFIMASCCAILMTACQTQEPASKVEAKPITKVIKKATPESASKTSDVQKTAQPSQDSTVLGIGDTPVDIKAGASHTYGSKPTMIEPPIALAAAIEKAKGSEGPYKIEAVVDQVCQKKGCWFTLNAKDVSIPIRVKMKNYAFFVPKNAMGSKAVLEGTFKKTQISQETAQHYADDAAEGTGKPAKKITGPQDTYMFMASSVYLAKPS